MEKVHSRINWENYPSIATPLNEANLNKMDKALDEVDNRVLGLDTAKLDKSTANTMVKDVTFDESTGIFTVTLLNGTAKTINTKLEKVVTNFRYDNQSQKLILTLADGSEQQVDLSSLISNYEFADGNIITFIIGSDGKVTANVKDGSITETKLQPNFLANVKTEVSKAKSYADSSYENATTSRNAVTEAKRYRDEALQFRNEAEQFAPEGYADLVEQVNENTVKVDTIIAKADLGIKETASGEEIHLTDSAEGKAVEFALYGKAKQNTTTGKNVLRFPYNHNSQTINGVTFTVNDDDKSVVANGTASGTVNFILKPRDNNYSFEKGSYILSGCPKGGSTTTYNITINKTVNGIGEVLCKEIGNGFNFEVLEEETPHSVFISIAKGVKVENLVFKPMIRLASITDDTYEPYTNGASPNPQYPQPIEVSGESGSVAVKSCGKNLLKNEGVSKNADGVVFTVNNDKSITINGTSTITTAIMINRSFVLKKGTYIVNGCNSQTGVYRLNVLNADGTVLIQQGKGEKTLILDEDTELISKIVISAGTEVNDTIYPMISLEGGEYEPYKETLATIPTENGLTGIKVSSGGNYTDQNGQQWICDEVVKYADGSGEKIQRINKKTIDGTANVSSSSASNENGTPFAVVISDGNVSILDALSDKYTCRKNKSIPLIEHGMLSVRKSNDGTKYFVYKISETATTPSEFKEELNNNPFKFMYVLAEPIHTPLTAEEIAEIEKLHTFYPVTNISNDFDCGMKITYNCDSKNYIDNKIALLTTAMINNI